MGDHDELLGMMDDRISRRRMIKRVGAGAAIVWTAPVLTSVAAPAFAQVGSPVACPPGSCDTCVARVECGQGGDKGVGRCSCYREVVTGACVCARGRCCTDNDPPQGLRPCTTTADCQNNHFCVETCCLDGAGNRLSYCLVECKEPQVVRVCGENEPSTDGGIGLGGGD